MNILIIPWCSVQWHPQLIRHYTNLRTYYRTGLYYRFWTYSSGHLVLSHFGTCMCSNFETNLSWTCLVSGLLNFEHPSVLLFCLLPNFGGFHRPLRRMRLAGGGRLLLRTPGPVQFGACVCSDVEAIFSWACRVCRPFEFRTSLGTSILLEFTAVPHFIIVYILFPCAEPGHQNNKTSETSWVSSKATKTGLTYEHWRSGLTVSDEPYEAWSNAYSWTGTLEKSLSFVSVCRWNSTETKPTNLLQTTCLSMRLDCDVMQQINKQIDFIYFSSWFQIWENVKLRADRLFFDIGL